MRLGSGGDAEHSAGDDRMTRVLLILLFVVALAAGAFLLHDVTHVPAPRSEAASLALPPHLLTPPATATLPTGPLVVVMATATATPYLTPRPTKTPKATLPACVTPVANQLCEWKPTPTFAPTSMATIERCETPVASGACRWPTDEPIATATRGVPTSAPLEGMR
jgi:hypothetical protein